MLTIDLFEEKKTIKIISEIVELVSKNTRILV